jgi:hypothetical protein
VRVRSPLTVGSGQCHPGRTALPRRPIHCSLPAAAPAIGTPRGPPPALQRAPLRRPSCCTRPAASRRPPSAPRWRCFTRRCRGTRRGGAASGNVDRPRPPHPRRRCLLERPGPGAARRGPRLAEEGVRVGVEHRRHAAGRRPEARVLRGRGTARRPRQPAWGLRPGVGRSGSMRLTFQVTRSHAPFCAPCCSQTGSHGGVIPPSTFRASGAIF